MASKASIPRFLLPQYGIIWRTTPARTAPFARTLNAELGQGLVRYASKTAATAKSTATAATTSKTAPAKKVTAPKAASTKATAAKSTVTKASTTKTTTTKVSPPKTVPTKTPTAAKAPTTKAATPKTPTSQPVVKATPVSTSQLAASKPAVKATPVATPKSATTEPIVKATLPSSLATPAATPSKPLILEKPEKFNPPSHGARLPRSTPKHYGGPLTSEEVHTQKTKEYPGLPPPENTWSHWFWNNRSIHLFITLGTLTSLAAYTFVAKFNATSTFADLVPPISEFPSHPIRYVRTCLEVLKLHEEHESAVTAEKRRRRVDDVAKRSEYRKAHGLDPAQGIESWTGSSLQSPASEPVLPSGNKSVPAIVPASHPVPEAQPETKPDLHLDADGKRKKFWGVF